MKNNHRVVIILIASVIVQSQRVTSLVTSRSRTVLDQKAEKTRLGSQGISRMQMHQLLCNVYVTKLSSLGS